MKHIFGNTALVAMLLFGLMSCKSLKEMSLPLASLTSGKWELQELFGTAVNAADYMKGLPSLSFADDGKLQGSTGCNQFFGDYAIEGASLALNPGGMSKMACEGDGEALFLNALNKVSGAKIDGDKLTLLDEGKKGIMEFLKAGS